MVRALAFHQRGPRSTSAPGVICRLRSDCSRITAMIIAYLICGLSLLVFYSAIRGFSPDTPVFPSHQRLTFDLIIILVK